MSNDMNGKAMSKIIETSTILECAIEFMDGCSRDRKFKRVDRDTFERMKMMLSGARKRLDDAIADDDAEVAA